VNIVTGPGPIVGAELVRNPGTNAIHFTDETKTGLELTRIAGIKRLMLELGGNGPLVVMDDANIDAAVDGTTQGCFYLAGQVCTASERILVHEKIHDEFVEKLLAKTRLLKVGDPLEEDTDMGPLNNWANAEKVQSHIDDARTKGAKFLLGGGSDGLYFEPMVIDDVTQDMLLAQDETFGPAAPIIAFGTVDEAIEIAKVGD
jgi:acyl-CoA reductase-like NAD-dependent aldehyde dehydrogenase